jgi:hypothetical protein
MTLQRAPLLLLALSLGTCNQAIMTAPPGSTMTLIANPPFIAAHGDVSVISALVLKATGNPVPDGTVVQFFTTLGNIDEQGKTNDGVARVNLVSDSRSGMATVSAFSGGGATTTPSPSPTAASAGSPVLAFSSGAVTGASSVLVTDASATVTVTIGSARPTRVLLTVTPQRLTESRTARVIALVFDAEGNPVANVPVVFSVVGATELLDSQGRPVFTDNSGEATDVLRTRYPIGSPQKTVTVTATTANGISATAVTVTIN